jgi:carbon storage regulator
MLVLSRKVGERIVIGPGIEVAVVDVQGGRVRLGIAAPADVGIRRSEVELSVLRLANPSGELSGTTR